MKISSSIFTLIFFSLILMLSSCRKDEVSPSNPLYEDDGTRDQFVGEWIFTKTENHRWGNYVWVDDDGSPMNVWQTYSASNVVSTTTGKIQKGLFNNELQINYNSNNNRAFRIRLYDENQFNVYQDEHNYAEFISDGHMGGCKEITANTFCLDLGTNYPNYSTSYNYVITAEKVE